MRSQCIDAVQQAIGRSITQAESRDIEQKVRESLSLARKNLTDQGQPLGRLTMFDEAARIAGQRIEAEAAKKRQRVALTILAHDRIEAATAGWAGGRMDAIERLLGFAADIKGGFSSVESQIKAIRANALRQLTPIFELTGKYADFWQDKNAVRHLTMEIFGEDSGNARAKAAAAEWRAVTEDMRGRFNDAGGDIGKLDDWGVPQHHEPVRVLKAGQSAWVTDVIGTLKRERYVNDDGSLYSDAQMTEFLEHAWETIVTGGINKAVPGQPQGSGMRANRGSESRQIHFRDAQAYLDYQARYGEKDLLGVMVGHVDRSAADIALVETFGPNANLGFDYALTQARKEIALTQGEGAAEQAALRVRNLYDFVAGRTPPVANQALARGFDTLRNFLVASRLGSAVITSLTDQATLYQTAHVNNLPAAQIARNQLAALNPANDQELRLARSAGLALDTMIGVLNRWGQDELGPTFSAKIAHSVIRASGLNALTDASRRAFGAVFMGQIGHLNTATARLADLDATDHRILLSKGITDADWAIWQKATREDWGNGNTTMLTPGAIERIADADIAAAIGKTEAIAIRRARRQAMTRLLATVSEETDMAVITPGARDRAAMLGFFSNPGRGTIGGELARSVLLFKSFPIAMIRRHWARGLGQETAGGKAAYIGRLLVTTTILGGLVTTLKDLLAGKDPPDFTDWRTGLRALLAGGSLGLYGDFLYSTETQHGTGALASLLGPVFGLAEDAGKLTFGNAWQAAKGEETHLGAELLKFGKGLLPGQNLWYTKAATDHLIFNQFQEALSPGYLAKVERRAQREFGTQYWWRPRELGPERAPDFTNLLNTEN